MTEIAEIACIMPNIPCSLYYPRLFVTLQSCTFLKIWDVTWVAFELLNAFSSHTNHADYLQYFCSLIQSLYILFTTQSYGRSFELVITTQVYSRYSQVPRQEPMYIPVFAGNVEGSTTNIFIFFQLILQQTEMVRTENQLNIFFFFFFLQNSVTSFPYQNPANKRICLQKMH